MGDDEQPVVGPTRDQTPRPLSEADGEPWTGPRHRSGRGGRTRARKERPPPEPEIEPAAETAPSEAPTAPTTEALSDAESITTDSIDVESVDAPYRDHAPAVGTAVVPAAGVAAIPTQTVRQQPVTVPSTVEDEHAWLDQEAGPVVRPYTLTGGRSRPFTSGLGLLTHIEALYAPDADLVGLQPEQRVILSLTRTATTLAELAARLDLPVGVVRILVGDLIQANLVSTFEADAAIRAPDDDILQAVLDGLRAL